MGPSPDEPIGLRVTRTAKALSRAFDAALAEGGGSAAARHPVFALTPTEPGP